MSEHTEPYLKTWGLEKGCSDVQQLWMLNCLKQGEILLCLDSEKQEKYFSGNKLKKHSFLFPVHI